MIDCGEALLWRRILKMKIINFIKNNQYLIGISSIIIVFFIVRLPYFIYFPIPFINGDILEYHKIIDLLESGSKIREGFPGIGYPLFILFCEKISKTTIFFIAVQSIIQLFAVLLFYYYYKVYLKKYLLYVAFILIGYLSSNINLYYDTAYHPDSLMGSLFIISIALLLRLIYKPSYYYYTILSFIVIFSISVRANGIVLILLIFIFLLHVFFKTKSMLTVTRYLGIIIIPTLFLCFFYFFSPIYKTFNIISYPSNLKGSIDYGTILEKSDSEIWKKIENLKLDKFLYSSKIDRNQIYDDTTFAIYVATKQRGYIVQQDINKDICIENYNETRSNWTGIKLDTVINKQDVKISKSYDSLKDFFNEKYYRKKLYVVPGASLKNRLMHFIGFYKLFYKSINMGDFYFGFENLCFYDENIKSRYGNCFSDLKNYKNDKRLIRSHKELNLLNLTSKNNLYKKMITDIWSFKISRYYRYVIQPIYKIQPFIFRNFFIPIILIMVIIMSFIFLLKTKFVSKLFIFSTLVCVLFLSTNLIFSFHFCYSYIRYTYQVSFVYYISLILLPLIIKSFSNKSLYDA